jgi:hypothetical protein
LGELTLILTFLTFSLEGVSLEVPPNQFARKRTKQFQNQPKNVNHRGNRTNENVTHVKNRRHET